MKRHINVVMGGPSVEHEISLLSGREVLKNLDRSLYEIRAVLIDRKGRFFFQDIANEIPEIAELSSPNTSRKFKGPFSPSGSEEIWKKCDAAFLALHGTFGEDGVIQGFLETIGIPYTGSGVYGSAVAMNKITSKYLYVQNGLDVPPYSVLFPDYSENDLAAVVHKHGFPCFIKCPQSGSSRLMGKATNEKELKALLVELFAHSGQILIESTIVGPEFSCGILEMEDGSVRALPPIEIRPVSADFFDYNAKYSDGGSQEIVPAPQPPELLARIEETALRAHLCLLCSGVSRTDMIYQNNTLYVLETNTLPGLTTASLLPKAFNAQGGTYGELLDLLIKVAIKKGHAAVS